MLKSSSGSGSPLLRLTDLVSALNRGIKNRLRPGKFVGAEDPPSDRAHHPF